MRALRRYGKVEAEARYFDGRSARPTTVHLSFGERALIISGADERPVAHWPLASLAATGERGDETLQIVPSRDSDERILVDDPRMIQALRAVCPDLHRRPVDHRGLGRVLLWGGTAVAAVVLVVFVVVPALSERLALMIPPEREMALGDSVVEQIRDVFGWIGEAPPGWCVEEEGVAALARMAERIDPKAALPYPLRIAAIDHGLVNAFAVPGGRIVLFRGLIEEAESPEEVAAVLAHEMAHVIHRDPTRAVLRSAGTAGIFGLVLGDVFGATIAVAAAEAVLNASYSREAEQTADETAYALLGDAGLPLTPMAEFFDRLAEEHGRNGNDGPLRYLASHPGLGGRAARAAAADRIGEGAFDAVLDDRGWVALKGICAETTVTLPEG